MVEAVFEGPHRAIFRYMNCIAETRETTPFLKRSVIEPIIR